MHFYAFFFSFQVQRGSLRQRSTLSNQSFSSTPPPSTTKDEPQSLPPPPPPPRQSTLSQALNSSANLANLLPTGTLLAFQLLTPIFTNNGSCDIATRPMTLILLALLGSSCFLASLTDSFKASNGHVYYGLATRKGLWLFDYPIEASMPDLSKYRLNFIDLVHGFLSALVFIAVALRDKNVVKCFYPDAGHEVQEVLDIVPIGIGILSTLMFMLFPTRRHGIGYPVTNDR